MSITPPLNHIGQVDIAIVVKKKQNKTKQKPTTRKKQNKNLLKLTLKAASSIHIRFTYGNAGADNEKYLHVCKGLSVNKDDKYMLKGAEIKVQSGKQITMFKQKQLDRFLRCVLFLKLSHN